jgi:hypothetical protein
MIRGELTGALGIDSRAADLSHSSWVGFFGQKMVATKNKVRAQTPRGVDYPRVYLDSGSGKVRFWPTHQAQPRKLHSWLTLSAGSAVVGSVR